MSKMSEDNRKAGAWRVITPSRCRGSTISRSVSDDTCQHGAEEKPRIMALTATLTRRWATVPTVGAEPGRASDGRPKERCERAQEGDGATVGERPGYPRPRINADAFRGDGPALVENRTNRGNVPEHQRPWNGQSCSIQ